MLREGRLSSRALQRMLADQQLSGFIVGAYMQHSSGYLSLHSHSTAVSPPQDVNTTLMTQQMTQQMHLNKNHVLGHKGTICSGPQLTSIACTAFWSGANA
jgi:hypothetical protein